MTGGEKRGHELSEVSMNIHITTIGAQLRYLRKENKMTLKQLSERSGISISYISDLEHDRNESASIMTIQTIVSCYGMTLGKFCGCRDDGFTFVASSWKKSAL